MKKIIIAAAILLTSGITAYSLNIQVHKSNHPEVAEKAVFSPKEVSHKADLGSAD